MKKDISTSNIIPTSNQFFFYYVISFLLHRTEDDGVPIFLKSQDHLGSRNRGNSYLVQSTMRNSHVNCYIASCPSISTTTRELRSTILWAIFLRRQIFLIDCKSRLVREMIEVSGSDVLVVTSS